MKTREEVRVTPENINKYVEKPIPYEKTTVDVGEVVLGLTKGIVDDVQYGLCIRFEHRDYDDRTPKSQEKYDALEADIKRKGIVDPIVVWQHPDTEEYHVLVGMRRTEIARKLGIGSLDAVVVQEDVREWWKYDKKRLNSLTKELSTSA